MTVDDGTGLGGVSDVAARRLLGLGERRRRLLARVTLVAALPLLAGLLQAPASADSPGQEPRTGDRTASVAITDVTPMTPGEGDTLSIRGTVTNHGASAIIGSSLDPRTAMPLTTRQSIAEAATRTRFDVALDGPILTEYGQDLERIPPGMTSTFSLRVPVSELALGEEGVYQIGVTLTGQTQAEQWGDQLLGSGRGVLPWLPQSEALSAAPTQLAVLWPLISTPHLTAQTGSDLEQTPAFRDDALLTEISPGGRLYEMVMLGADLPVTWVIDPDLLASVDAMTEGYQVNTEEGLTAGDGQEEARAWLGALQEAVADSEVIALPFGDPDLASLAHQGSEIPGALNQFREATEKAAVTVETTLGVEPSTDFSWPVEGAIDPGIVSVATSAGAGSIISRSDSLRPSGVETATPTAARPIGEGVTAVVADETLSTLFEGDMASTSRASRAQQQLLAHTLAITLEEPANEQSVAVAPQRMPTADQARAMAGGLTALAEQAWVEFTDLTEAASAASDAAAQQQVPPAVQYPDRLRAQELPTSAFQEMRETERTLEDFQVVLTQEHRVAVPYGNAIARGMSTSWRGSEDEAQEYRTDLQDDLVGLTEQVHLIQKSDITLSGRSATIPVTVQNNLVQDVQSLELRLESSRALGLDVSDPQAVTINGGHSQSVEFSADSRANGRFTLQAQLYTEDGEPYGAPMQFNANVTSITSAVMMVIAGGLLLVVLAGIRMYTQRKRATQAALAVAGHRAPEGETAADTGHRAGDAPARGERLGTDD